MKYIFGPVPSRRLGLSLGIDLLGKKHCNLSCVYCELGRTLNYTSKRKVYVSTGDVLTELDNFFESGGRADVLTFSGNGEPTLALNLGEIIDAVKQKYDIQTALITNSILFYDKVLRQEAAKVDIVLPSLDAGSEDVFKKINRPHKDVEFEKVIQGLIDFSKEYTGRILLEVLIVKGINDSDESLMKIRKIIDKMDNVEEIQMNTVVRLKAEEYADPVDESMLKHAVEIMGERAKIIGKFKGPVIRAVDNAGKTILDIVRLRPVTIEELEEVTGFKKVVIIKETGLMEEKGLITRTKHGNNEYYKGK